MHLSRCGVGTARKERAGQAQGAFKGTSSLGPYLSDHTRGESHWASGGLLWLRLSHWGLVSALGDLDRFSVCSIVVEVGEYVLDNKISSGLWPLC